MRDSYAPEAYLLPSEVAGKSRAIIYCGFGKKRDAGASRTSSQYDSCLGFAQCAGLEVVAHYEDAGTYFTHRRPQLETAICQIELGKADVLLVEDMNRLHRDIEQDLLVRRRVLAAGGALIFSEDHRDGSPTQQLGSGLIQVVARFLSLTKNT